MPATHFVLVHGSCHGAWCWYKLKPLLEEAGHRVTALDMAASGIDLRTYHTLRTLDDYSRPLLEFMETISVEEKVVLVGHSFGGFNLGLCMDKYPDKIVVAVFATAFMPDSVHKPSYAFDQYNEQVATTPEAWLDTVFSSYGTPEKPQTSTLFGPQFISKKLYHLSPPEDVALAKMLVRRTLFFLEDMFRRSEFSNERFGAVPRVYIVCTEDKAIPNCFQQWLIETIGATEIKEIKNADHMPMLSKPQELCQCLVEIASKYTS